MSLETELKESYFQSHPVWAAASVENMSTAELAEDLNNLSTTSLVACTF